MEKHQKSILLNISWSYYCILNEALFFFHPFMCVLLLEYWKYYLNHSLPTNEYSEIPQV